MTAEPMTPVQAGRPARSAVPVLEARDVSKFFGRVVALEDVSLSVRAGEVNCLLGDNGAGKSTLIKILSGVHRPDAGTLLIDGQPVVLQSPRDALSRGIATVYQDLAVLPLMSVSRNFFMGSEPTLGFGPFKRIDLGRADRVAREQMAEIGIELRDTSQLVGTLSGGERQTLAIARAEYFGAKVLILDEPTSALGVKEAAIVLRHVIRARSKGLGVIFITHNVQHALPVGDTFTILSHGRLGGIFRRGQLSADQLLRHMGGGEELQELSQELEALAAEERASGDVSPTQVMQDEELAREVAALAVRQTDEPPST
ncbi:MAG: sugar ABC transporter ATP-binding protein [Chloroflexi bacterium]|nr:sugar ABC transporter ATP-binding protein [Chloroflexota bacterium]